MWAHMGPRTSHVPLGLTLLALLTTVAATEPLPNQVPRIGATNSDANGAPNQKPVTALPFASTKVHLPLKEDTIQVQSSSIRFPGRRQLPTSGIAESASSTNRKQSPHGKDFNAAFTDEDGASARSLRGTRRDRLLVTACVDLDPSCAIYKEKGYCSGWYRYDGNGVSGVKLYFYDYWCPKTCYYCNAPPPPPPSPPSPPPPPVQSYQTQLLALVNQGRAANGKAPLCLNSKLNDAAYGHSLDMYSKDYFSHTGLDGSSPGNRIERAGYSGWSNWGENIAEGQTSVDEVYIAWKNSVGHWRNILGDFKHMGIARVGNYWVQDFGSSTKQICAEASLPDRSLSPPPKTPPPRSPPPRSPPPRSPPPRSPPPRSPAVRRSPPHSSPPPVWTSPPPRSPPPTSPRPPPVPVILPSRRPPPNGHPSPPAISHPSTCFDRLSYCGNWKESGYCAPSYYDKDANGTVRYVFSYWCPLTCNYCNRPPPPPATRPPRSPPPPPVVAWQTALLALVNQGRAENGKPPLCLNFKLNAAAQKHSSSMNKNNFYGHTSLDGSGVGDRIEREGYTTWLTWGENIAKGPTTVRQVYDEWKKSPSHWENILGDYLHMGVGKAGTYWTQDFGFSRKETCVT